MIDPQPFAAAVKSAVEAQSIAYAEAKKPTVAAGAPYIVGWPGSGLVFDRSLLSRDGFSVDVVLHAYGGSPDSVRVAVRKGRTAIESLSGDTVGGRVVLPPVHQSSPPMQRDDTGTSPIWWQPDYWRIPTSPA